LIDQVVRDALGEGGRSVVEFGPGLDTRFFRLGEKAARWVEVDFPEVISLRQRFLDPDPKRTLIARSMLDFAWIDEAAHLGERPLFIAEGVLYFLTAAQVREFLTTLADRFPGSSIIFDCMGAWYIKLANLQHPVAGSRLLYSVGRNGKEFPKWDSRLKVERYIGYGDKPYYNAMLARFSLWKRAAVRLFPIARHEFKIIQLGLDPDSRKSGTAK
jgi:O-methyltransferase involved in polyketide biosynthesis